MRIGHPGTASVGDLCVQLISALTDAELVRVPYTGAGPSIVALRGEHIEAVVSSLGALTPPLKAGTLRAIVASSPLPEFAHVPMMRDLGFQDELFGMWFSVLAPVGIPEDARKVLAASIEEAVKEPGITARLALLGIFRATPPPSRPRPRSARSSGGCARSRKEAAS